MLGGWTVTDLAPGCAAKEYLQWPSFALIVTLTV